MSRTRRFRIGSTSAVGVLALVILGLLPGVALADHGDIDDCYEYETGTAEVDGGGVSAPGGIGTAPGEEGGVDDEPVPSDDADTSTAEPIYVCYGGGGTEAGGGEFPSSGGTDPDRDGTAADGDARTLAAAGPACGGGGGGGGGGVSDGAGLLAPDSGTADVDSGVADLDEQWAAASVMATGQRLSRATIYGCVRNVALIGGLDDGVVAPTRIDAGAGGAAAGTSVPALALSVTTLLGAACEVVRRRRR